MSATVISIESVSKLYRLGSIGARTLRDDVDRWVARIRGKPDPLLKIGQTDHGNREGEDIWALRDVSFEVKEGEVLGIIGRNGAGKSTLLKILSRVTAPTEGQVKIKGRIASLLEVGTGFHPELTGRENIFLNGAILGMSSTEIRGKFDEIVEFSGVERFIDTPVKRYSSGMYVRVAFAVAAHLRSEILLVDEVLAVGDAEFQKRCLGKMGEVARSGRTVLFVSHNLATISALCNRVILLESGKKHSEGVVENVLIAYASLLEESRGERANFVRDQVVSGSVRITDIRLTGSKGEESQVFQTGRDVCVDISYQATRPLSIPLFYLGVNDALGCRVFFLDSSEGGGLPGSLPLAGRVRCCIERLPLPPGFYSMNVAVKDGGELADHITRVVDLSVVAGDFFGTGVLNSHSRSCLLTHSWEWGAGAGRFDGAGRRESH